MKPHMIIVNEDEFPLMGLHVLYGSSDKRDYYLFIEFEKFKLGFGAWPYEIPAKYVIGEVLQLKGPEITRIQIADDSASIYLYDGTVINGSATKESFSSREIELNRRILSKGKEESATDVASRPCPVCKWIHDGHDLTSFRDKRRRYVFKPETHGHKVLVHLHKGMLEGAIDVNYDTVYPGDLNAAFRSSKQPDAYHDLIHITAPRRACIKLPEEPSCPSLSKPAKNPRKTRVRS